MGKVYTTPRKWWQLSRPRASETWQDNPRLRALNDGWGSCNTGAFAPGVCSLGGIGCNVDHKAIAAGRK